MKNVLCPHCSFLLEDDGSLAGRSVLCPACHRELQMPSVLPFVASAPRSVVRGARQKSAAPLVIAGIGIAMLFGLVLLLTTLLGKAPSPAAPAKPAAEKSPEMQAKRLALIEDLISQGVFLKVQVSNGHPRVWITPLFRVANIDQKNAFLGVVYAYHFDGSKPLDTVVLYDSQTGSRAGYFSSAGLSLE